MPGRSRHRSPNRSTPGFWKECFLVRARSVLNNAPPEPASEASRLSGIGERRVLSGGKLAAACGGYVSRRGSRFISRRRQDSCRSPAQGDELPKPSASVEEALHGDFSTTISCLAEGQRSAATRGGSTDMR